MPSFRSFTFCDFCGGLWVELDSSILFEAIGFLLPLLDSLDFDSRILDLIASSNGVRLAETRIIFALCIGQPASGFFPLRHSTTMSGGSRGLRQNCHRNRTSSTQKTYHNLWCMSTPQLSIFPCLHPSSTRPVKTSWGCSPWLDPKLRLKWICPTIRFRPIMSY